MLKACVVLLADTDTHEAAGRMANALSTVKEFAEADDEVSLVFDGAGTKWVPVLEAEEHSYHRAYAEIADHIAGACAYCAAAFGVKEQIEASRVGLLSDFGGHPSLRTFSSDGYQIMTF